MNSQHFPLQTDVTSSTDRSPGESASSCFTPSHPGRSTAFGFNVAYRLDKLCRGNLLYGTWLDCGCADGGYTTPIRQLGAERVVGIDVELDRVHLAATRRGAPGTSFACTVAEALPFHDTSFEGVFLNEVLEHVVDERRTLAEIYRVLRVGGHLALFSPNRLFPFEGHGIKLGSWPVHGPIPVLPWIPMRLASKFVTQEARNYWPGELQGLVEAAGFEIVDRRSALPVLELYRWLPAPLSRLYRRLIPALEATPLIRHFGVSTFILARRPAL